MINKLGLDLFPQRYWLKNMTSTSPYNFLPKRSPGRDQLAPPPPTEGCLTWHATGGCGGGHPARDILEPVLLILRVEAPVLLLHLTHLDHKITMFNYGTLTVQSKDVDLASTGNFLNFEQILNVEKSKPAKANF